MRSSRKAVAALIAASALAAPSARADDKKACIAAYEEGQTRRADGKLRSARAALASCEALCPASLAKDCTAWLRDLEKETPTTIVEARDHEGHDVPGARATLDGERVETNVETPIDPGDHVARVEVDGAAPAELRFTIARGEKRRATTVIVSRAPATPPTVEPPRLSPSPALPPPLAPRPSSLPSPRWMDERPVPIEAIVFGGAGVLALGGFAAFGLTNLAKRSDLEACKPSCSPDSTRSVANGFLAADVFLGVGVSALAIGTALYLLRPTVRRPVVGQLGRR